MQASSLKASSFKRWIETMTVKGYEVCSAKGVFAGEEAEGHLLVAVFGISRQETESAARRTPIGMGLFIGRDCIPQFICISS